MRPSELEKLIAQMPVPISIALDPDCKAVRINSAFSRILGIALSPGSSTVALDHAKLPCIVMREGEQVPQDQFPLELAAKGTRVMDWEAEFVHPVGASFHLIGSAVPLFDEQGAVCGSIAVFQDITVRKQHESRLLAMQSNAEDRAIILGMATQVATNVLSSLTGIEALQHIADAARTLVHAQYAALGVASTDGQELLEFITSGLTLEEEAAIGSRPKGLGVLGLLLQREKPLRVDILSDHPSSVGFPDNHPPMNSFLGVPIRRGEVALGSLYLTEKEGGDPFTEADEIAIQALAAHAAVAIHHLRLLSRQRALVTGLIAAQEEERRAVAYDLHDGLVQYVMASQAHFETFRRAHALEDEAKAEREMDLGLQYLKQAVIESRRLVNGLRTLTLDDLGLAGAIESLIAQEKKQAGWQDAELMHNIAGRRYHRDLETTAFRVAQEALTNAQKHASASRVRVALIEEGEGTVARLKLEVRDWGGGFDPDQVSQDRSHVGLHSMEGRVHLLGGTFSLQSSVEAGTIVRAVFPVIETDSVEETDH